MRYKRYRIMYNKLFTKILDSSIWMETTPTRIVWLTFIAAMDENGMVQFASIANLAHRAIVTIEEATIAVRCLESPDPNSADSDNEGRRIERVDGGWLVLNAHKYRELVTKAVIQEQTRKRVAAFRKRNATVTQSNANIKNVTPSVSIAVSVSNNKTTLSDFKIFWDAYPKKVAKKVALKAWTKAKPPLEVILTALEAQKKLAQWQRDGGQFIPLPATWINQERWLDESDTMKSRDPWSTLDEKMRKEGKYA